MTPIDRLRARGLRWVDKYPYGQRRVGVHYADGSWEGIDDPEEELTELAAICEQFSDLRPNYVRRMTTDDICDEQDEILRLHDELYKPDGTPERYAIIKANNEAYTQELKEAYATLPDC